MSIRLHPEYGVNPTIPTCFYCGESKNEIILLGPASKKITGQDEAPMHGPVFDLEPCDKCREYMNQGIILIGVDEARTHNKDNPWRTGEFLVVSETWIRRSIRQDNLRDDILAHRMAFVPSAIAQQLLTSHQSAASNCHEEPV